MRLACLLACLAVAAAGCGGGASDVVRATPAAGAGGQPATSTPSVSPVTTPQPLRYLHGARAAMAAGQIAVVDLSDRVGVQPASMDVNAEQTLDALRWSGWGNASATGRGKVDTLVCDPTCATGKRETSKAEIVLSKPRLCGRRRFYTRSTMTYVEPGTDRTRAPDTYLRTPPC
jgi:hypothetical protein